MIRITLRMPEDMVSGIEELTEGSYPNRSEVIRDATRKLLEQKGVLTDDDAPEGTGEALSTPFEVREALREKDGDA